ncbi:hypothetical protein D4M24_11805 [Escherichia coli]|nr:hypothetical protein D4M24_11805 [Escherichia coli]
MKDQTLSGRKSWTEANRLIDEQASRVKPRRKICDIVAALRNLLTTGDGFMINHLVIGEDRNGRACSCNSRLSLPLEQSRLAQMQEKAQSIQDVLAGLEDRRVALIRQQAAECCGVPVHAGYERSVYGIQPSAGAGE